MDLGLSCTIAADEPDLVARIADAARLAEGAGASSWWAPGEGDAPTGLDGVTRLDGTLTLQAVARATTRLRIAYAGEAPAIQPAAVRAKQVATLDWFSGGRLEIGLDLADPPPGLVDPAHADEAGGPGGSVHLDRALDRLTAMRSLWTAPRAAHRSPRHETFAFRGAVARPRPVGERVPTIHLRHDSAAHVGRLAEVVGVPVGLLAWLADPAELATASAAWDEALGDDAPSARRTWCVRSADRGAAIAALPSLAERGVRVDELVILLDGLHHGEVAAALAPVTTSEGGAA